MLWLKGCPKCGGDLQEESDKFGPCIICIQCGHYSVELEARQLRSSDQPHLRRVTAPRVDVPARMAS